MKSDASTPISSVDSRLTRVTIVDRLDYDYRDEWTGEISVPFDAEERTGTHSIADMQLAMERADIRMRREPTQLELKLRIATGIIALLFLAVVFFDGLRIASKRSGEDGVQLWREIPVEILATPKDAKVYIDGVERGKTPFREKLFCRGESVRVHLQKEGYANWAYNGICPKKGKLSLSAQMHNLQ